jgi:hypothetical protein
MHTLPTRKQLNYFRIAWQSALAAALGLGLPAGLLLWLILIQQVIPSAALTQAVRFLQAYGLNKILVLALCSLVWSFFLARISGYHPWWKLGFATILGIFIGWFSPLSNIDGWLREGTPIHIVYAAAMGGIVSGATLFVGLSYGFVLHNLKAGLMMALFSSVIAVFSLLLTIFVFDQQGIRVGGSVPLAMSKVTVTGLLAAAIAGGVVLGVTFSRFVAQINHTTNNA